MCDARLPSEQKDGRRDVTRQARDGRAVIYVTFSYW